MIRCGKIGLFSNVLQINLLSKLAQIFAKFCGYFENISFEVYKKLLFILLGQHLTILGNNLFRNLVTLLVIAAGCAALSTFVDSQFK